MCFVQEHSLEYAQDPRVDQEAIANINSQFYNDDQFDVVEYNLQVILGLNWQLDYFELI